MTAPTPLALDVAWSVELRTGSVGSAAAALGLAGWLVEAGAGAGLRT